jgi:hypothetical protein
MTLSYNSSIHTPLADEGKTVTEQLTTFVEMLAHLDLDAYMPLPKPHRQTFHKLKRLRTHAQSGNNSALIQELQDENQPDELVRVYAASIIVGSLINDEQLEILGGFLRSDKNTSVRIALAKKLKEIPLAEATSWLLQTILYDPDITVRVITAEAIRAISAKSWDVWQEKVTTALTLLERSGLYREHIDTASLVAAILPPYSLIQIPDDRLRLTDFLVGVATKYNNNPRMAGIIAALIIHNCNHNLQRVLSCINQFKANQQHSNDNLTLLQAEVNSLLTPTELHDNLKDSYQTPLQAMQRDVHNKWKLSIFSAQFGLVLRFVVSLILSIIGLILLGYGAFNLSNEATWPVSFLQIGLGLILLLIFLFYRGTIRDVQQTLVNISIANTVYATFTQQSLDISHRYTTLSLQNQLTSAEIQASHKLLAEAMKNAVYTLRGEKPPTLEDLLEEYS